MAVTGNRGAGGGARGGAGAEAAGGAGPFGTGPPGVYIGTGRFGGAEGGFPFLVLAVLKREWRSAERSGFPTCGGVDDEPWGRDAVGFPAGAFSCLWSPGAKGFPSPTGAKGFPMPLAGRLTFGASPVISFLFCACVGFDFRVLTLSGRGRCSVTGPAMAPPAASSIRLCTTTKSFDV